MSVCVNKNMVSFMATGIVNDWAKVRAPRERACTVVDTRECDWTPNTVTQAELLGSLEYRVNLRSADYGQSYIAFYPKVTPCKVVARWYLL